ncbi:hypothetical protein MMPV_001949 [Pyropia vietnamensis]
MMAFGAPAVVGASSAFLRSSAAVCRGTRFGRWGCAPSDFSSGAARWTAKVPDAAGAGNDDGRVAGAAKTKAAKPVKKVAAAAAAATPKAAKKVRAPKVESIYKSTVNLPETGFSQRANAVTREPELQAAWAAARVYERLSRGSPGEPYVLHDGPPYANGALHMGHALNKVLKDFLNRYQLSRGRRARLIPGWDCHGLPIELKVLQSLSSTERRQSTPLSLRRRAASFARETVDAQRQAFQRFGVWADWEEPYLTLTPAYEAAQVGVFGDMFLAGHIYRGRKPVHWSPSSRTALAEAELEYPDGHVSRSCYVSFPAVAASLPPAVVAALGGADAVAATPVRLAIWTTTPWTMPANRAIGVNVRLRYSAVSGLVASDPAALLLVADDLVGAVAAKLGIDPSTTSVVATWTGAELVGIRYTHPLDASLGDACRIVEGGDYITTDSGTGLVHTAPGHGLEDYAVGLREGLDLASPVDDAGRFTDEAAGGRFTGLPVLGEGNQAVLDALAESGALLAEEAYPHKYPYDWRSKKPTIFRATDQWFASIDGFRDAVLSAVDTVSWLPAAGEKRIRSMVEGRSDWCISRQRAWGVPIPVFYKVDEAAGTREAVLDGAILAHVRDLIAVHGSDVWWEREADELLPADHRGKGLVKGTDTMDVWFDSGSSWASVTGGEAADGGLASFPADVYLEGSDQHRGWFQSSLLTSVAARGIAPFKTVLTHGFVLDAAGIKMSKSIGNVVDPLRIVNGGNNLKQQPAYGADVLRLWVSSVDYSSDVLIGDGILSQVADVYRKLRNTLRYMAGNVADFDPATDAVPVDDLPGLDRFMLYRLAELRDEATAAYDAYSFSRVYTAAQRFAVTDLSNFYLDIAKDRLYVAAPQSFRRRACQTVLAELLHVYTRLLAPILPHTAEDLWQNLPYTPACAPPMVADSSPTTGLVRSSIFEAGWPTAEPVWSALPADAVTKWELVRAVRDDVNKVLEAARVAKTLGASLEARVVVAATSPADAAVLAALCPPGGAANGVDELRVALIVSAVDLADGEAAVAACAHTNLGGGADGGAAAATDRRVLVGVDKADGPKCDRCWHYSPMVGTSDPHPLLCDRCVEAVTSMGMATAPTAGVAV